MIGADDLQDQVNLYHALMAQLSIVSGRMTRRNQVNKVLYHGGVDHEPERECSICSLVHLAHSIGRIE